MSSAQKCMSSKKVESLVDDIHINERNSLLIYAFFSPLYADGRQFALLPI